MTSPSPSAAPSPPAERTAPDKDYLPWLLPALQRAEIRAALRRGDIPAMQDRAYRYLARYWSGAVWLRTPLLLHAAATAAHPTLRHAEKTGLGDLAADLVERNVLSASTVAARLLAVQRMDLPVAHRHLAGILHAGAVQRLTLDWHQLYRLYRSWDFPTVDGRRRNRRRLLEQFHTRVPG
ncbi:type I-E CRISPR-associated protein Cse2/CasB [Dactylosporangium aurantiacum]|uniref:Type I-E CRISPR-associated protein Cse2/CasB n=1 Tax=Dactylosporangium aurantiacum TaxID=35754 RepID=A0A9Q9IJ66_9ACTN|nr:type I-E CRISPR-associated protein Cse2/CasB [Dactylosporangium aurantiacum]MDG6108821.1 type I-E CRISPR-associated protein Cse2/CasB [Dactylosporangium aurantiacum]UWZ55773.1 type I-E CRISPR-associated protein Cse2/CasB [Dactylosporangium aurantiacum]